jgi:hypothetical protein
MAPFRLASLVLCVVLVLYVPFAFAEKLFDFQETTLDNGMRVVTLEDFSKTQTGRDSPTCSNT